MRKSPRFKVTADGTVLTRRRPVIAILSALADVLEWIDGCLDAIPCWEHDGLTGRHWFRYGGWGCRIRLGRIWTRLPDA
jgi:hypothetical protein